MAILGEWQGNSVSILPSTTFAAPNGLFSGTAARNDGSAYSLASATSTLTLPASNLADGYLLVAAFEFEDTSNGRHNPQGRFVQASGTGNFVTNSTSGFNRDNSEDRSYVRCWAFVDSPSASATFQFQWRRDGDVPTGGTVRSHLQVIPLYYAHHGIYSSASNACPGGTAVSQVVGWSAISESDTAQIELAANAVALKGDNKRYLCLGGQYWQGIGTSRTQRWHGFRIDGVLDNSVRAYSYARNAANADIGNLFTTLVETATADVSLDQIVFRGEAVGTFPNTGGDVNGNTTGSNPAHAMVVLELNDSAEVFRSRSNLQQSLQTAGSRVAIDLVGTVDFNDSASFTKASNGGMNLETGMDLLFGSNVAGGYNSTSTQRHTAYIDATLNGTAQTYLFDGNYGRGNQGTQDTWGWSAHLLGFVAGTTNQDLGIDGGKITGGEGGTVHALAGWSQLWGVNLDTLEGISSVSLTPADALHAHTADQPAIATAAALALDGAVHAHIADTPSLGIGSGLAPADSIHLHFAGQPVLGSQADLALAGSTHGHLAGSPSLDAGSALSPDDAIHIHLAQSVALAVAGSIAIDGALHGLSSDEAVLATVAPIQPDDAFHIHAADSATLSVAGALSINEALHGHTADQVSLAVAFQISINDAAHALANDEPDLGSAGTIAPADALHGNAADEADLSTSAGVSIDNSAHEHAAEAPTLVQVFGLPIDDALHGHLASQPALVVEFGISPADSSHGHTADPAPVSPNVDLAIESTVHATYPLDVVLAAGSLLIIENSSHVHFAQHVDLDAGGGLSVDSALHNHLAGESRVGDPIITPGYRICVGEQDPRITTDNQAARLIVGSAAPRLATSLTTPQITAG